MVVYAWYVITKRFIAFAKTVKIVYYKTEMKIVKTNTVSFRKSRIRPSMCKTWRKKTKNIKYTSSASCTVMFPYGLGGSHIFANTTSSHYLLLCILYYSKASRYTASSCTDLDSARFWIGSKKTWDARFWIIFTLAARFCMIFCTLLHDFLHNFARFCTKFHFLKVDIIFFCFQEWIKKVAAFEMSQWDKILSEGAFYFYTTAYS